MGEPERIVRTTAVVARVVAGETLVVPVRAKVGDLASIYKFNGTGTLIWRLLATPHTLATLSAAVAEHYQFEIAQVESDVVAFVNDMKDVGLVEAAASLPMPGD
jgi:glucan biosynthesis protein